MSALDDAARVYVGSPERKSALDEAAAQYAGSEPIVAPKSIKPLPMKSPGMMDVIGNGLVKGAAGFGDMIGNGLVNAANLGIAGYGVAAHAVTGKADSMPELIDREKLSGYRKLAEAAGLIDPAKEPTTPAQRVADYTAQVVGGGGINPMALGRSVMSGKVIEPLLQLITPVLGGVAGGVTSELTRNATDSPTANTLLPLLAQIAGSYPTAHMSPAGARAAQTTKNVTPEQWEQAKAISAKAAALGSPISATEALQAVTGTNPGLQSLQRLTEQSGPGVNKLAPAYAKRPAQNAALFGKVADGIYANETDPGAIAGTLQKAAMGSIDAARRDGNAQAAPFYARSSNDPNVKIPPADWNAVASDPAIQWALNAVKKDPLLGVQNAQPGSLQWLDAAKKYLDSKGSSLSQAGDNFPAGQATGAANRITSAVDPISPDYAKARSIIANNMSTVVEPMQAGQIGKLANSSDFTTQAGQLLPEKPMDITPSVVRNTAQTIGAQDPKIIPRFASQYLRGTFNEANQDLQNGANQGGGAKFAARIAGNQGQAANLESLLSSSGIDPTGLNDALSVWRAQGTRPPVGSATTFNNGETGLLSGGLLSAAGSPLKIPGLLAEKAAYSTSTRDLANTLYPDANSVIRLQGLARSNGSYSPMAQAVGAAGVKAATPPGQSWSYDDFLKQFDAAPDIDTKRALNLKYAAYVASLPGGGTASQSETPAP